jgi:hypothetical protein
MGTVISGTFADRAAAHEAVERLRAAGIPTADISIIVRDTETLGEPRVRDAEVRRGPSTREEEAPAEHDTAETPSATVKGAEIGGIGGLLIGLGALTVPGSLPIVAAGPVLAALGGAAVGAAVGGFVGALEELGVPEEHASVHAADVERGHVLLAVRTDAASQARARDLMTQAGALNLYPPAVSPPGTLAG